MSKSKEVATVQNGLALPGLSKKKRSPISLNTEYWYPEKGENKRVYVVKIAEELVKDSLSDDPTAQKKLLCATLAEPNDDGTITVWRQAGTQLVGDLLSAANEGRILTVLDADAENPPTGLEITYEGKKANRTNQYKHDSFKIALLV